MFHLFRHCSGFKKLVTLVCLSQLTELFITPRKLPHGTSTFHRLFWIALFVSYFLCPLEFHKSNLENNWWRLCVSNICRAAGGWQKWKQNPNTCSFLWTCWTQSTVNFFALRMLSFLKNAQLHHFCIKVAFGPEYAVDGHRPLSVDAL